MGRRHLFIFWLWICVSHHSICGCGGGQRALGEICTAADECSNALCLDGVCSGPCEQHRDCPTSMQCQELGPSFEQLSNVCVRIDANACESPRDCAAGLTCVAHKALSHVTFSCEAGDRTGLRVLGASCDDDAECQSNLCHGQRCSGPCALSSSVDCAADFDLVCEPETISLVGGVARRGLCVGPQACTSDVNCSGGRTCQFVRGEAGLARVCLPTPVGTKPAGSACVIDDECSSGLCLDGGCVAPCLTDSNCGVGQACVVVPVTAGDTPTSVSVCVGSSGLPCQADAECRSLEMCTARRLGDEIVLACASVMKTNVPIAAPCQNDSDCPHNLCVTGACAAPCGTDRDCGSFDLRCQATEIPVSHGFTVLDVCRSVPTCEADGDCAAGDCCVIGFYPNMDASTACLPRDPEQRSTGMSCSSHEQCQNGMCLDTDDGRVCTEPCATSGDCWVENWVCELQPVPGHASLKARVCMPPAPATPCLANSSCAATGSVCGDLRFQYEEESTTMDSYCVSPISGGADIGESCTGGVSRNEICRERVCLSEVSNTCSTPCRTSSDCVRPLAGLICTDVPFADLARFCMMGCRRDAACADDEGLTCGIARNVTDDRYDLVCRLGMGAQVVGSDCSQQNACDHGICLARSESRDGGPVVVEEFCTRPCESDTDCPSDTTSWNWSCVTATLTRPVSGGGQAVNVCSRTPKG